MLEFQSPSKGNTIKLNLAGSKRERILVGLSWEPNAKKGSQSYYGVQLLNSLKIIVRNPELIKLFIQNPDLLTQKEDSEDREKDDPHYDLDLCCFAIDKEGNCKNWITPDAYNAIDTTEKIYHSGESMDGAGVLDDEQIHIELKNLEEHYKHFFIIVESDCMHRLSMMEGSKIRLADGSTNTDFLSCEISKLKESDKYSFVFCQIFHDGIEWNLKNISEFAQENENWPEYLKKYL